MTRDTEQMPFPTRSVDCCEPCGAPLAATPRCAKCGEPNPKWPSIQAYLRSRRIGREKRREHGSKTHA